MYAVLAHGVEENAARLHVGLLVPRGVRHGLAHDGLGGEMDHTVDRFGGERLVEPVPVPDPALDQERERWDRGPVAGRQVVQHDRGVARADQLFRDDAADVAGAARDQRVHGRATEAWMARSAAGGSGARKMECPATNESAPAAAAARAVSASIPPSTSRRQSYPPAAIARRTAAIRSGAPGRNGCPPAPGSTVITS